jgi:hypothetical protein
MIMILLGLSIQHHYAFAQTTSTSSVSLEIVAGDIICTHGWFDFGYVLVSENPQVVSGFSLSPFGCADLKWSDVHLLQVNMSTGISNNLTHIPRSDIQITPSNITHTCAGWVLVSWAPFATAADVWITIDLIRKNNPGDICLYYTTPILSLVLPANASTGAYNGTIIVTYPY